MTTTMPASTRVEKTAALKARLDDHLQELAEQMSQGKSEGLLRYLEFTAQFHAYSFGNVMLILCQRPDATRVAGLRQWNRLGRHVRAGEKGIMIFAPMTVNKRVKEEERAAAREDDETPQKLTLFKVVHVFDVGQTDGDPLPRIIEAEGDASDSLPALRQAIIRSGIALEEAEHASPSMTARGASYGGRIILKRGLPEADAFRTLVHEFAHELLHWPKDGSPKEPDKTIRETEADATAFVVCRHFGVQCDTSDYLLLYDAEPKHLIERLETIRATAARIIGDIGGESAELEKVRGEE